MAYSPLPAAPPPAAAAGDFPNAAAGGSGDALAASAPASRPAASNPHPALDPLIDALRRSPGTAVVAPRAAAPALLRRYGMLAVALRNIAAYCVLAADIWRCAGKARIVVREFSTFNFLLPAILCAALGSRCLLINSHNVQQAAGNAWAKMLLRCYGRLGFRLVVFEAGEDDRARIFAALGLRCLGIPTPSCPNPAIARRRQGGDRTVVGMVGDFRAEKGMAGVVGALAAARSDGAAGFELKVGVRGAPGALALPAGVEVCSTDDWDDYAAFLSGLDILVVPYPQDGYYWRISGIVAEAASNGIAVVCTDLPLLTAQVSRPVPVGVGIPYADFFGARLVAAIDAAARDLPVFRGNLSAYVAGRSADAVLAVLDDQLAGRAHRAA